MIFRDIRTFWAKMVRLGRIAFSWAEKRKTLRIIYPKALIYVYAIFILLSPFAKISTAHAPVLAAVDVAQIERQKETVQLKKELRFFLRRYNSSLGSDYIEAILAVENKYRMKGFSKLATAVAFNESYLAQVYPEGSYNIWGLGASSPSRWIDYDSWKEGATDFYKVVKRLGMDRVTYQDLLKISRAYVGTSKWRQWGDKIWRFYRRI